MLLYIACSFLQPSNDPGPTASVLEISRTLQSRSISLLELTIRALTHMPDLQGLHHVLHIMRVPQYLEPEWWQGLQRISKNNEDQHDQKRTSASNNTKHNLDTNLSLEISGGWRESRDGEIGREEGIRVCGRGISGVGEWYKIYVYFKKGKTDTIQLLRKTYLRGVIAWQNLKVTDSSQSYQVTDPSFETVRWFVSWHRLEESVEFILGQVTTPSTGDFLVSWIPFLK